MMSAEFKNQWQKPEESPTASYPFQTDAVLGSSHVSDAEMIEIGCRGDRFELLSAYLDGEVRAAERHQVEVWLAADPQMQQLHARLLTLRQELQTFGTMQPPASVSAHETVARVMQRLDRRPQRVVRWGGAAIAATLIGAVTLMVSPLGRSPIGQYAETPASGTSSTGLQIALDAPVIDIPNVDSLSNVTQ
jgi:predicted anti-sigma-YlaC factor YlaD